MSGNPRRFLRFGPFTFRLADHVLLCGGAPIDLPPRTAEILGFLLQNRDHVVSKRELRDTLWAGVNIEANSLDRHVSDLRKVLNERQAGTSYIETHYKRGWQFVGKVTEEAALPSPASDLAVTPETNRKWLQRTALIATFVIIAAAAFGSLLMLNPEPKVIEYIQLTNDGRQKAGPLLTDGRRIFFTEAFGASSKLMSIPITGGEAVTLDVPLPNFALQDISSNGSTLLLRSVTRMETGCGRIRFQEAPFGLWEVRPRPVGRPRVKPL
ncbi:MAG: winged helix-turn-helix domain-containing protein [Bryobacteraceae bacterium]